MLTGFLVSGREDFFLFSNFSQTITVSLCLVVKIIVLAVKTSNRNETLKTHQKRNLNSPLMT